MKKIFTYTKREEELINKQLGYTKENFNTPTSFIQYHCKINASLIKTLIAFLLRKKCCHCEHRLTGLKEYTYIGLRHRDRATSGDYVKAYSVSFHLYCEHCKKVIDLSPKSEKDYTMQKKDIIPMELWELGISLESLGFDDFAWDYASFMKIMECFEQNGVYVLGGDVCRYWQDKIELTGDSWFYNDGGSYLDSINQARQYVTDYYHQNGDNYIYSIVIGETQ